jgi:N-acetylneuraminic acid mutarotase
MSKSVALLLVLVFLSGTLIILATPASAVDPDSWTTKAPVPTTEGVDDAAVVNGKIYAMEQFFNYEYDPVTDVWVEKTPMPTPRANFAIAVYENKIYVIGAYGYSCANEVYDPATDTWESLEPMPVNRSGIDASVVNGKIHLMGLYSHDVYDVANDSWTIKERPPLHFLFTSVAFDEKIYTFGWNETQIYDPVNDTWTLGASPPNLVAGAGVCATTGLMAPKRIYLIGGGPALLDILWSGNTQVYDPENDSWTLGADMLTACYGSTVVVVNDQIYALDGAQSLYSHIKANQQYTPIGYGTVQPEITVVSPENTTYPSGNISLVFTLNKPASCMGYSLDGQDNITITGNITLSSLSSGLHNVTVYAKDELGNTGFSKTATFTIAEPFPAVPVAVASVAVVASVSAGVIVYFKKRKH